MRSLPHCHPTLQRQCTLCAFGPAVTGARRVEGICCACSPHCLGRVGMVWALVTALLPFHHRVGSCWGFPCQAATPNSIHSLPAQLLPIFQAAQCPAAQAAARKGESWQWQGDVPLRVPQKQTLCKSPRPQPECTYRQHGRLEVGV